MKTFQKIVSVVCTLAVIVTITSSFPIGETFVRAEEIQQTKDTYKIRSSGETFVYEDLFYEVLDDGNLMLRGPSDLVYNAKELVIPAEVNGKKVTRIREYAFNGRGLVSVEIPDTITHIGSSAFGLCMNLKSVKMGNTLKSVGSCAFESTSIETLTLPDSVIKINWGAFANCVSLKSVTIPSGVKIISERLFMGCTGLEKVTIPDSVTEINDYAFSDCTGLVSISLPHNIKAINYSTFDNCSNLESVFISNSTNEIEKCAFSGCYKLNDVYFSGTREQWDEISISYSNEELKKATIHYNSTDPNSLEDEAEPISEKCGDNLTCTLDENGLLTISGTGEMYDFELEGPAPWWQSNLNSVFDKSLSVKAVTIENGVSSIGGNAFWNCDDIKSISLPESVVTIGGGAFLGCTGLTSISIPKSTTKIEAYNGRSGGIWGTFANCSSLTEINVDGDNQCYKSINGILFTKDGTELIAYPVGKQNEKYSIPSSVKTVGDCAFNGSKNLRNVIIPNSVTSIGSGAFQGCTELTGISIPNSVSELGGQTFRDCTNLTTATIPNSIISIGWGDFAGCSSLSSITIPNSVTTISEDAFIDCSNLTKVIIPDSVTRIGGYAFSGCSSLSSITIPNSVTAISEAAFIDCSNLTKVIIPDSVTYIEHHAFLDCQNLTSVTIPDSVTSIGYGAFDECSNLKDVYYSGTEDKWNRIEISMDNDCLISATIHYTGTDLNDIGEPLVEKVTLNGHTYQLFKFDNVTSRDVISYCRKIGGYMAHINDAEENTFLSNYVRENSIRYAYFGYTDEEVEGDWKWVDGKNSSYTNWGYNEPNNEYGEEHYAIINQNGFWNDGKFEGDSANGGVFVICEWESEHTIKQSASNIHFLSNFDPKTGKVNFDSSSTSILLYYTLADTIDKELAASLVNKYVLGEIDSDSLTITDLKPVESKIGTIYAIDKNAYTITIDEVVYPLSRDNSVLTLFDDQQIGKDVLSHTYEGTVVALNFVEKKIGKLESWDNTAQELTIDGKVYPTNYMSNLSGVEELVGKEIVFLTTLGAYSPVFKVELYNQPVVDSFNADIYHANKLVENPKTLKPLDEQTPSYEMQDSLTENVNKFWISFSKLMDIGSSPSSVYNYASGIDQKDMYEALILDSLKATVSYYKTTSKLEEESVKISKEFVNDLSTYLQTKHLIDLNNIPEFKEIASDPKLSKDVEDYAEIWFKKSHPKWSSWSEKLKIFSTAFKVTGCIEDVTDYYSSCITLAQIDSNIIKILEQSYQYCLNNSNYGANDPLTQAFLEVREMYETGKSGVWSSLLEGSVKIVGVGAVEYLCDELWDEVLKGTVLKNPNAAIILAGISAGKTVTKLLFNSDDVAEQYIKMKSITDIEAVVDEIFDKNQSAFKIQSNEQNAKLFLASMRLSFQIRDVDCDQAIKYLDELDKGLLNRLPPNWGNTREKQKQVLQNKKSAYQNQYWNAESLWVEFLKDDYPDSSLFEKYSPLLSDESMKEFFDIKKESMAWCPINIYVYDDQDNLVAYIENGRVSCSADDLTIAQNGDEKVIRFHSNANYRVEYVGYDTGDMDVTINEFGADSKIERTVNYNNVLLNNGKAYSLNFASENMKPYNLVDKENGSDRSFDYDSMSATGKHNVKIISGTMRQNDVTCIETAASNGEVLYLDAFVPEGYTLVNWECSSNNAIIDDIIATNTKMIMPDEDVIVTAVLNVDNSVHKVSFNTNGGEVSPLHKMTGINSRLEALPTPVYENHTFDGWFTAAEGGEQITAGTTFTENTTVYAHWTKNNGDSNNSNRGSSLLTGVTIAIISILLAVGVLVVIFRKKHKKH